MEGKRAWLARASGGVLLLAAVLFALVATARSAAAQGPDAVYTPDQLSELPRLASPTRTAELIRGSYPAALRDKGVGGTVQLQFIVNADGKVDAASVEVAATTNEQLGAAAKAVAAKLEFKPGALNGTKVRTKVILPIVYKP